MAARNPQTQAKRARELAVRERRDLKRAKKAEAAAARRAGVDESENTDQPGSDEPETERE
ncbi:MAG TPA: hypothetical protein VHD91_10930 [Gaiellaceae bacterium]|nr:hypothetical protein [Gaiellaceae bacterium]